METLKCCGNDTKYKRFNDDYDSKRNGRSKKLIAVVVILFIVFGLSSWGFTEWFFCSKHDAELEGQNVDLLQMQKQHLETRIRHQENDIAEAQKKTIKLNDNLKYLREQNDLLNRQKASLTEQVNVFTTQIQNLTTDIHHLRDGDSTSLQRNLEYSKELGECKSRIKKLEKDEAKKSANLFDYNGFRYQLTKTKQSWEKSRDICQERGGILAVHGINDLNTLSAITDALCIGQTWVGLSKHEFGSWEWTSGINRATKMSLMWADGEPNNVHGNENCAELLFGSYQLNDYKCSSKQKALCEFNL